jgi:predicted Rossmann fold flavoprotein
VNKRLIPVILRVAGFTEFTKPAGQVSQNEIGKLVEVLKDWRFPVTGTTSWPNAQVTTGGVDVSQVDEETLESRIMPGLYFAGEVLDIDGDCGGFNLQWAWSSGYVAGTFAGQMRFTSFRA